MEYLSTTTLNGSSTQIYHMDLTTNNKIMISLNFISPYLDDNTGGTGKDNNMKIKLSLEMKTNKNKKEKVWQLISFLQIVKYILVIVGLIKAIWPNII